MQVLQTWVKNYGGTSKLAKRLGITPWTVRHWLRREGYPKVETMGVLIDLSKGKLTYETIIESTKPRSKSN